MENTNYKLNRFINAVNEDIDGKVSRIISDAEKEKQSIIEAAHAASEATANQHMTLTKKKYDNTYVRNLSTAELNMKKEILHHREHLADMVFMAVTDKLAAFRKTPEYEDKLKAMLVGINFGSKAEIRLAPSDMKFETSLRAEISSGCKVSFVPDSSILLGGMSVYSVDNGTIADKTYDLSVEEQKNAFIGSNAFAE